MENNMKQPIIASDKLSGKEKVGYATGDLACNLIFSTVGAFLMYFYTDVYGLAPMAVSMIFLVARIWDGLNDPIMGVIVDRTKSKHGKFRPYLLYGALPFTLIAILCFTVPDISPIGKFVYAFVTYIGLGMIYTLVNVPYGALTSAMTQDSTERANLSVVRMFFASVGTLIVTYGVPKLSTILGGENLAKGYQQAMIIYGIAGGLLLLFCFFTTKERYSVVNEDSEKAGFKDIIVLLKNNKPLVILSLIFILMFGIMSIVDAVGIYFFQYVLGREDLLPTYMILGKGAVLVGYAVTPLLLKKFDKKEIIFWFTVVTLSLPIGMMFLGKEHITLIMILRVIHGIAYSSTGIMWSLVPDTIEYGELKTGKRREGITYSIIGFFFKFGMALGGLVPGVVLSMTGYVANTSQTSQALYGIRSINGIIPVVLTVAMLVLIKMYPLTEEKCREVINELRSR
ncbi:sugar/Na+(H+) simporter [Clostridioides difficile]|uniref:MFS transporter n=1 Tax=Clostridioides difficile TaxID=1496 RepID=UPI000D1E586C|nr:MFS transporter [Clostridioides difficile]UWD41503.1 MFS transporter [Clostridioides difficile]UWD45145.1 MFS transporter [Clostridioides difficile]VFF94701.1 sugar/Na+(H+) simporter [Clostridioides difficile]VIF97706.1 sugar/Na+(H+) simporter [Clostridioides difficile]VIG10861.1 sugar/Na+(H+) simporter [Clostridioides difficile]